MHRFSAAAVRGGDARSGSNSGIWPDCSRKADGQSFTFRYEDPVHRRALDEPTTRNPRSYAAVGSAESQFDQARPRSGPNHDESVGRIPVAHPQTAHSSPSRPFHLNVIVPPHPRRGHGCVWPSFGVVFGTEKARPETPPNRWGVVAVYYYYSEVYDSQHDHP